MKFTAVVGPTAVVALSCISEHLSYPASVFNESNIVLQTVNNMVKRSSWFGLGIIRGPLTKVWGSPQQVIIFS